MALTDIDSGRLADNVFDVVGSNKNRIINGDMRIDQRNVGASTTINTTANTYTLDRWFASGENTDGVFTVAQTTDGPAGFSNSARVTVTTADASIGATQIYLFRQAIEGTNVSDLEFGNADAKTISFSFWVRSSLTGTFGGALNNSANNRNYPFTYTISSASTWEYKTVTVTGDTTGTWLTDANRGLTLTFQIGAGSSRVAAAGSWNGTSDIYGATGATNIIGTLNATWDITGVQLEVGSVATPFEHRNFTDELLRCERYFCKSYTYVHAPGDNEDASLQGLRNWDTSTRTDVPANVRFPTQLRVNPAIVLYSRNGTANNISESSDGFSHGGNRSVSAVRGIGRRGYSAISCSGITSLQFYIWHWTADSEL